MVTRVIGIPDGKGIIRVSCGTDIIEIEVVSPPATGAASDTVRPPGTNPVDIPYARMAQQLFGNPNDWPQTWITTPSNPDGKIDIKEALLRLMEQKEDPRRSDPVGVVVDASSANLHDLVDLSEQIAKTLPGLPVAIKFKDK